MMNTEESSSSQFTIKRLFWMLIIASVVFKLADVSGVFSTISRAWDLTEGISRGVLVFSLIIFALIVMAYIAWFGIRLPWLLEHFRTIRKKRRERQQRFRDQYEALRSEADTR